MNTAPPSYITNCYIENHDNNDEPIIAFLPDDQVRIYLHDMAIIPLKKYEKLCAVSDNALTTVEPLSPKSDNFEHAMRLVGK